MNICYAFRPRGSPLWCLSKGAVSHSSNCKSCPVPQICSYCDVLLGPTHLWGEPPLQVFCEEARSEPSCSRLRAMYVYITSLQWQEHLAGSPELQMLAELSLGPGYVVPGVCLVCLEKAELLSAPQTGVGQSVCKHEELGVPFRIRNFTGRKLGR